MNNQMVGNRSSVEMVPSNESLKMMLGHGSSTPPRTISDFSSNTAQS